MAYDPSRPYEDRYPSGHETNGFDGFVDAATLPGILGLWI